MAFLVDENVQSVEIAVGAPQRELFQLFQLIKGTLKAMPIRNSFLKR